MDDSAQSSSDTNAVSSSTPSDPPVDTTVSQSPAASDDVSTQVFPTDTPPTPIEPDATPSSTISSPSKETGVPHFSDQAIGKNTPNYAEADKVAKAEGDEYWEHYAREIELEKTVEDLGGIEKVESGEVTLPTDVAKEMGIDPTVTVHTPMQDATGFSVGGFALSDDQVATGLKKPTGSAFRWLAEWFVLQLVKAHYHVKRVGGKVLRGTSPTEEK